LDVLLALEQLHDIGYVHRDLKPANVLLINGEWQLGDFGLVRSPDGLTTKLTSVDSIWGTAEYCAPEQAVDFRNATAAADIYAFGCILHDLYVNERRIPYRRHSATGEIGEIIEKCTEENPAKRFQSAKSLREVLLPLLSTAPALAVGKTASDWIGEVGKGKSFDPGKTMALIRYLALEASRTDFRAVLRELNEDLFLRIQSSNADGFKTLSLIYCEWIEQSEFNFEHCDLLTAKLELIYGPGDYETKAAAVLAGAAMGRGHNRWFVMERVLQICAPDMDDNVARRVAIEIRAREVISNFVRCAQVIGRDIERFHPRIAQVLKGGAQ
jgi:eukaryotic-like serine/threonine-protein kinase